MERDWKDRLADESLELSERIERLDGFMYSDHSKDDDVLRAQLELMMIQLHVMCAYKLILSERIRLAGF